MYVCKQSYVVKKLSTLVITHLDLVYQLDCLGKNQMKCKWHLLNKFNVGGSVVESRHTG
jgi:hypothetical protein